MTEQNLFSERVDILELTVLSHILQVTLQKTIRGCAVFPIVKKIYVSI